MYRSRGGERCRACNVRIGFKIKLGTIELVKVKIKVKVQFTLQQATKVQRVVDIYLYSFFNLGARGFGSSTTRFVLFTPVKTQYPFYRRLGGTLGPIWTIAVNLAPQGFDPRSVKPVGSRYTD